MDTTDTENKQDKSLYFHALEQFMLYECEEALSAINKYMEKVKTSKTYFFRARINYAMGNYQEAILDLNESINLNPEKSSVNYFLRGSIKEILGHYSGAITDLKESIQKSSNLLIASFSHGILSSIYEREMNVIEALSALAAESAINPTPECFVDIARLSARHGYLSDALDYITKAIELDPKYVEAYHVRSVYYMHLKKYEDALEDCENTLLLEESDPVYLNNRGCCYLLLDRHKEAFNDFTRVLELSPQLFSAYKNRLITPSATNFFVWNESENNLISSLALPEDQDPFKKRINQFISDDCHGEMAISFEPEKLSIQITEPYIKTIC
jgi:tetratricopeptide (TPR) repeat protein